MNTDDFEERLRRQSLRPIPHEWRREILDAAGCAGEPQPSTFDSRATSWWREWLWPCPQAWAGIAAVWMILLGLYFTPPSSSRAMTAQTPAPSPEARVALAAQRREMARLLEGPAEPAPASNTTIPGPRSERTAPSPSKV